MIATRAGRFDDARRLLELADEVTAAFTDVQLRGGFHVQVAELALLEGRPDDAYRSVEQALALAAGTDDATVRPEMIALAVRCVADQLAEAQAHGRRVDVDKARRIADGFEQEALQLLAALVEHGGRCPPRTYGLVTTCVAERTRLYESDPDCWDEAAARWDIAGEPHPEAYCRWREAEALLDRRRERSRAEASLLEAWRLTVELGTTPLRERIEQLARRARISLPDGEAEPARGSTVAADLGLTPARSRSCTTSPTAGPTGRSRRCCSSARRR